MEKQIQINFVLKPKSKKYYMDIGDWCTRYAPSPLNISLEIRVLIPPHTLHFPKPSTPAPMFSLWSNKKFHLLFLYIISVYKLIFLLPLSSGNNIKHLFLCIFLFLLFHALILLPLVVSSPTMACSLDSLQTKTIYEMKN